MNKLYLPPLLNIHRSFQSSFKWTLAGSVLYESLKVFHCYLLMVFLSSENYGAMGSIFSFIYLMTYVADLGATNSLPAYIQIITKSRQRLSAFLIRYSLLPHLPIALGCASIATYFALTRFPLRPTLLIIPAIIIFEAVRTFLRMLLHTLFKSRHAVIIELIIFFAYIAATWIPTIIYKIPLTLNYIFSLHLIDSVISVTLFVFLILRQYTTTKDTDTTPLHLSFVTVLKARIFNYLLRVSRNLFTSNFLTPLFAIKFGLTSAGIFYFASMFANAIQSVVKSAIGYSGNALLANIKDADHQTKCEAFAILSTKLLTILAPPLVLILTNINHLVTLGTGNNLSGQTLGITMLFVTISFTEFFFILYEQFYVIEEAAQKLFIIKIIELGIFYSFITSNVVQSPVTTVAWLIAIRLVSFVIIATNAWIIWGIRLQPKSVRKIIITCAIIGGVINLGGFLFLQ